MAGALVFYLWSARHAWFAFDEWDFLSGRSAGSLPDLLRPHNEHWSTLPILLWRALFHVFGLGSYTPYLLALLVAHLGLALLIRVVMRRSGVRPWTATIAASLFLLLGSGADDILWAFQIGFVGALVFGFVQLLLADHDGPIGGRDALASIAGLTALLCSGVGVTMVVVVGIATWSRRGWRPAVVQTAPLAGIYVLWWSTYGRKGYHEVTKVGDIPSFIWNIGATTFRGLAQMTQQLLLQPVAPFSVPSGCRHLTTSTVVTSTRNAMVLANSAHRATVTYLPDAGPTPAPVVIGPLAPSPGVRFVVGGLRFDVRPDPGGQVLVCG